MVMENHGKFLNGEEVPAVLENDNMLFGLKNYKLQGIVWENGKKIYKQDMEIRCHILPFEINDTHYVFVVYQREDDGKYYLQYTSYDLEKGARQFNTMHVSKENTPELQNYKRCLKEFFDANPEYSVWI